MATGSTTPPANLKLITEITTIADGNLDYS